MALARLDTTSKGKVPTGYADEIVISDATFRENFNAYERSDGPPRKKQKREAKGDSAVVFGEGSYKGPWARFEQEAPDAVPRAADEGLGSDEEEVEEVEEISEYEEDALPAQPDQKRIGGYKPATDVQETSVFLGEEEVDYQGRSWLFNGSRMEIPDKCYPSKRVIHTWKDPTSKSGKAHDGAVNRIRFHPTNPNLVLSAGADSKMVVWSVNSPRQAMRSYQAHTKSVSDVDFAPDGDRFVSCAYDRTLKLMDTESGTAISRFSANATPHCISVNPAQPHQFVAGFSDSIIRHYDTRTDKKEPVTQYDHHLSSINTLIWIDEGRRFISTSTDLSLRAWEDQVNVPIRILSDPTMHSLSRVCARGDRTVLYMAANSQILAYDTQKVRQNRKKQWTGHSSAGYAIDVSVSGAGDVVTSGSSDGSAVFWSYKDCRLLQKVQVSESPLLSLAFNPTTTSRVACGDADGVLKYLD